MSFDGVSHLTVLGTGDRSCEKLSSRIPQHRERHYILKCLRESFESVASAENLTNNQNRFISGTGEHTNVPLFQLSFTVVSMSQFCIVNILDDMAIMYLRHGGLEGSTKSVIYHFTICYTKP